VAIYFGMFTRLESVRNGESKTAGRGPERPRPSVLSIR